MVMFAAIGGIVGAKVYYAILTRDWHNLISRAGLVWYGGLIGGFVACSILILRQKVDYLTAADATSPALAIGYSLGRIGCFLVGDDYGRPTDGWFGIAFPKGSPPTTAYALREFGVKIPAAISDDTILRVHPTQLYESAAALVMFFILLTLAKLPHVKGRVFGMFLMLMGLERFLVEIVRAKDDRFFGSFTVAQLISVIIAIAGVYLFFRTDRVIEPDLTPAPHARSH
jgi:phosphatidylglycerol:prolipoprotein diacylglycerol transferase